MYARRVQRLYPEMRACPHRIRPRYSTRSAGGACLGSVTTTTARADAGGAYAVIPNMPTAANASTMGFSDMSILLRLAATIAASNQKQRRPFALVDANTRVVQDRFHFVRSWERVFSRSIWREIPRDVKMR